MIGLWFYKLVLLVNVLQFFFVGYRYNIIIVDFQEFFIKFKVLVFEV